MSYLRPEGQTFEEYKTHRKAYNKALRYKLRGTLVWCAINLAYNKVNADGNPIYNSKIKPLGTYCYKKHGELKLES